MFRKVNIQHQERALFFKDNKLQHVYGEGRHWVVSTGKCRLERVWQKEVLFLHEDLEQIRQSGLLDAELEFVDLGDNQRALVFVEKRFWMILGPGLHALWKSPKAIKVEVVDATKILFKHDSQAQLMNHKEVATWFNVYGIEENHVGIVYMDGDYFDTLKSGSYLFWRNQGKIKLFLMDLRERIVDISGQEIMTRDKVTLRVNATLSFKITDPLLALNSVDDVNQSLYREGQFALRSLLGNHDLDALLTAKDQLSNELVNMVASKGREIGVELRHLGIKDIVLPGEMKELLNKVTEAQKAAEANLIARREEVAAMRNQANSAKMLEANPVLMRLKELEVLERVAQHSKLNLVLGDKSLRDQITHMI